MYFVESGPFWIFLLSSLNFPFCCMVLIVYWIHIFLESVMDAFFLHTQTHVWYFLVVHFS